MEIEKSCKDCIYFSEGYIHTEKPWKGLFYCKKHEKIYTMLLPCEYYQKSSRSKE